MLFREYIPNLLTVFRILLAPAAIVILAKWDQYTVSGIIFLVCCFTDFLDGYLARKWSVESSFGKTFDPIADKFLIVGILIVLLIKDRVIGFVGFTLMARDVIMDVMRLFLWRLRKIIPAIKSAKIKTVLQMLGIALILLIPSFHRDSCGWFFSSSSIYLQHIPLVLAMIFSLWSFGVYLYRLNKR